MQIQTGGDQEELESAVKRLFDKGMRNLPDSWELAEAAAWDFFIRFRDRETAIHFAELAARHPDAPSRVKRMLGVWRDKESAWTLEDSIEYWRQAVEDAEEEWDRAMCMNQLYDAVAARDRQQLNPLLRAYTLRFGRCPESWEEVVRAGAIRQVPHDFFGDPYGIGAEDCSLVAFKKFKDQ
jgi:hypothetical protein